MYSPAEIAALDSLISLIAALRSRQQPRGFDQAALSGSKQKRRSGGIPQHQMNQRKLLESERRAGIANGSSSSREQSAR